MKLCVLLNLWNQIDFHSLPQIRICLNPLFGTLFARNQKFVDFSLDHHLAYRDPVAATWPLLMLLVGDLFFSLARARTVRPFCITCCDVILRWVSCLGTARRCMRLVRGGVLTGNPGQSPRVQCFFHCNGQFHIQSCWFFSQFAVKPSESLKL